MLKNKFYKLVHYIDTPFSNLVVIQTYDLNRICGNVFEQWGNI